MARRLTPTLLVFSLTLPSLAAQEPPVLLTNPPVQTAQFGAAALGNGVTEVAQLQFTPDLSAPTPTWFLSATVRVTGNRYYVPYSATVTGRPGNYVVTPNSAYSQVPAQIGDYFCANVSADLRVMVTDTGPSTPAAVFVRTSTAVPFAPFGSIGAPVPRTYNSSQIGDTIVPWDGTTGSYEYTFVSGYDIARTTITLTAPSTVTVGPIETVVTSAPIQAHSPSPMRQWTGAPADRGKVRALLYSQNDFFADSYFRSSAVEAAVDPLAGLPTYSNLHWKANPGHIGGATYWAYASTAYVDPLLEEIVAMNSAFVPATGGTATLCVWTPPSTTPRYCFVLLGALQSPGLNLGLSSVVGRLAIRPFSMAILPAVQADADYGEAIYTLRTPPMPPGTIIDMQAGCFEPGSGRIALGSSAVLRGG